MNEKRISRTKRTFLLSAILFLSFACFLFTGCSRGEKNEGDTGYAIYCMDTNETKILSEYYTPVNDDTKPLIEELVARMSKEPEDISLKKVIPDNVNLEEYTIDENGILSLYWNSEYGNYTGVSEILRRASIVKTLCQIPEINSIAFYVAGQPLTDSNSDAIGFMTADMFIDNTGKETYTLDVNLTLYFSDSKGTSLVPLSVKTTYDASIPLEQLVLQKLMSDPNQISQDKGNGLLKTIPKGTKINKVSVKDNTCYLDLSEEFLKKRTDISDEVAIYSVVNTLAELPNINKVQFSIDGKQVLLYDDIVNFGEPFEVNLDIIRK